MLSALGNVNNDISVDLPLPKKPNLLSITFVSTHVTQREHIYSASLSPLLMCCRRTTLHYTCVHAYALNSLLINGRLFLEDHIPLPDHILGNLKGELKDDSSLSYNDVFCLLDGPLISFLLPCCVLLHMTLPSSTHYASILHINGKLPL